jgi:hypothetical protein
MRSAPETEVDLFDRNDAQPDSFVHALRPAEDPAIRRAPG